MNELRPCFIWVPKCNSIRTTLRLATPEVWFRIVHIAARLNDATGSTYANQTIEIALGPNGAPHDCTVATLTRRAPPTRALTATRSPRPKPTSSRKPRTPRVVETLRKALRWRAELESGTVANQAAIASREGITRARVTQIMALLSLTPEIQQQILLMPRNRGRASISECALRPLLGLNPRDQVTAVGSLLSCAGPSSHQS